MCEKLPTYWRKLLSTRSASNVFLFIALGGIIISLSWWAILNSSEQHMSAKYKVLFDMEGKLEAGIYRDEWKFLQERRKYGRLKNTTPGTRMVAKVVPLVFAGIYAAALVSFELHL